jgi:hypothetical protein
MPINTINEETPARGDAPGSLALCRGQAGKHLDCIGEPNVYHLSRARRKPRL